MTASATTGFLHGGTPYLRLGDGPPFVMVQGLTPQHEVPPKGFERRMLASSLAPLAVHVTVHSVNRKRGLRLGESMSDIAGHLADAIEHDIGHPVFLSGTSSGGSVALQLAIDRPDLVRRLIVVSAACRLGAEGRALDAEMIRLTRASDLQRRVDEPVRRDAAEAAARPAAARRATAGPTVRQDDVTDMLVSLEAECPLDLTADLPRVTAPTLVVGGTKDVFYPRDVLKETASGVVDGRCHLFESWGHLRASASKKTTKVMLDFLLEDEPRIT
jgi:pimeloyl-ACP methyl ester carboxylesterase